MKSKVLTILLVVFLLVGCGQNGADNASESSNLQAVENEAQESEADSQTVESANESDAEVSKGTETPTESTDAEEPPYVLTFEATTTEGETVTSDCFADSKLTMINIWGTYCNPCLAEMPDLGEIAASYDTGDFRLIGVVCDVPEGADEADVDNAKVLIEETGANYTHLLLSESLYTNLVGGTDAVPTTFFVNQKGEVLGYVVGANSKETWVSLIEQLLAEME